MAWLGLARMRCTVEFRTNIYYREIRRPFLDKLHFREGSVVPGGHVPLVLAMAHEQAENLPAVSKKQHCFEGLFKVPPWSSAKRCRHDVNETVQKKKYCLLLILASRAEREAIWIAKPSQRGTPHTAVGGPMTSCDCSNKSPCSNY